MGRTIVVERRDLAVDYQIRQRARLLCDRAEFPGPVETFSGLQSYLAALRPELHTVAIELDFMAPVCAGWWAVDRSAKLGRDEVRHRGGFSRYAARRGCPLLGLSVLLSVGVPHCIRFTATALCGHEQRWC